MLGESHPRYDTVAAASRYLADLLNNPPYRTTWETVARQRHLTTRRGELLQEAVRLVYVEYLHKNELLEPKHRERHETERYTSGTDKKRLLKDKISRALTGVVLTEETVDEFIAAFGLSGFHGEQLHLILRGDDSAPIAIGDATRPPSLPPPEHETLLLVEEHHLGRNGSPTCHVSEQRIRALRDDLTHFPYRFDTDRITVRVMRGATAGEVTAVGDGIWEVPIIFTEPLKFGQLAKFKFSSRFHYESPPRTDFRRAVTGRLESLDIRVKFHRDRVPSRIWWTQWADFPDDSPIIRSEPVVMNDDLTVDRYLKYVERAVVGFRWAW